MIAVHTPFSPTRTRDPGRASATLLFRAGRVALLVLLAMVMSAASECSERRPRKDDARDVEAVTRMEHEWLRALLRGDRATVERILSPDFVFTGRSGRLHGRDEEVSGIGPPSDSANRLVDLYADDEHVRVFGSAAVITGRVVETSLRDGKSRSLFSRYTDTYVRRAGRWQVVASQLTRLEPSLQVVVKDTVALRGDSRNLEGVAFSRGGHMLASASNGGRITLWEFPSLREFRTLSGVNFTEICFSPDEQAVVAAGFDSTVRVWRTTTGEPIWTGAYPGACEAVAISPDGKEVAAGGGDHAIHVWEAQDGRQRIVLRGHRDDVYTLKFTPDGKYLVSGGRDRTIRIWDASTGRELRTLHGYEDSVYGVAISPDGTLLASACRDGTISIWSTGSWQLKYRLKGHTNSVHGVAFRPDGAVLASAGFDDTVRLWDVATGIPLIVLEGHTKKVSEVAFSSDGNWLASASSDGTVRLSRIE